jgi:NAD(P)H-flavin reductase/hemoglobin-like flavoprotein
MNTAGLRASWATVAASGPSAAELFYAVLFTLAPELRAMFPVAMGTQRDKLLAALGHIVSHVDDPSLVAGFITQLGRDHRRFSVAEHHYPIVGRALLATLQRSLGPSWTSELAGDWASAYALVSELMIDGARHSAAVEPSWWDARVVAVQRRTTHITVLTVQPELPYPFVPGQSVAVECPLRPRLWRYLSPANAPRADNTIEFHVRAVAGGQVSPALAYRLQVGDTVKLAAPIGAALARACSSVRDLLLIAGGTGLAPLRSIVEYLAEMPVHDRVSLVVGAHTVADLYDRDALVRLDQRCRWLDIIPAIAADPTWRGQTGTAVQVALRQRDWTGHDIFVCGSPNMVAATVGALRRAGYPGESIHTERFSNDTITPALVADLADRSTRP